MRIVLSLVLLASAASAMAASHVCSLLTPAEISAAVPGAKAGKPDASREKFGITACEWPTSHGIFIAQRWKSEGDSAKDEIEALMIGFVDPMNQNATANVRFETLAGVGDQAIAVVETKDEKRGVRKEVAMLIAKRGDQVLMLLSTDLPRADRAQALAALKSLAQKSLPRL